MLIRKEHVICAYVLIGYPKDTRYAAEVRLKKVLDLGITPFAMLWRDAQGNVDKAWRSLQRQYTRTEIIYAKKNIDTVSNQSELEIGAANEIRQSH